MTKLQKRQADLIAYLQSIGAKQNKAGNWQYIGAWHKYIIYIANNVKIKQDGKIIYSQPVNKTYDCTLKQQLCIGGF